MEAKTPFISVVLPVYNCEKYIKESINSILNQTFKDFELIIVNDASTDSSPEIINSYKDARIIVINNLLNEGIPKSRNKGLETAKGKYYAVMDADDIADKNRFLYQFRFLEKNKDINIVGSHILLINEDSQLIGKRIYKTQHSDIKYDCLIGSPVAHPTLMIKMDILKKEGFYNNEFAVGQDYELIMRLINKYAVSNLNMFLLSYRIRKGQTKQSNLKQSFRNVLRVQKSFYLQQENRSYKFIILYPIKKLMLYLPETILLQIYKLMFKLNNII